MSDCVFCKIIKGELPSNKVYENGDVVAFRDINPVAPVHVLVVPKKHIASLNEEGVETVAGSLFEAVRKTAEKLGIAKDGYRCIINTGKHAAQSVHHLHIHLIGGKQLGWPGG